MAPDEKDENEKELEAVQDEQNELDDASEMLQRHDRLRQVTLSKSGINGPALIHFVLYSSCPRCFVLLH